jgi:pimeloyl-ACP methyl ester carboxylesterase
MALKKKMARPARDRDPDYREEIDMIEQQLKAPNAFLMALESRAPWEFGAMLAAWPLLKNAPEGDGHPVVVFPGLGAGDLSTAPLRNYLSSLGYDTYGWDLGRNLGPREGVLQKSVDRIINIHEATGQKVSLIGWSLGGIYAREFAKTLPKSVRNVITLGTPFAGDPKATNAWWFYQYASGHKPDDPALVAHIKEPPPVPCSSIYSRTDGVVAWQLSHQQAGARTENIEIIASHIGIGLNPVAFYAVADRLSQPDGKWKKFDRSGWRQTFFRDTERSASCWF